MNASCVSDFSVSQPRNINEGLADITCLSGCFPSDAALAATTLQELSYEEPSLGFPGWEVFGAGLPIHSVWDVDVCA